MIQFMKNGHHMDVGLYLQMIHGQNVHVLIFRLAPTVNTIDITALPNITLENIRKHPTGVLVAFAVIALFWGIITCISREMINLWLHNYVHGHNYNNVNEINLS